MSASVRRRRAVFLLALALACGGLAASEVGGRVAEVESRTGAPVPVVVAAREVRARGAAEGRRPGRARRSCALRAGRRGTDRDGTGRGAGPGRPAAGRVRDDRRAGRRGAASARASPALRRGERAVQVAVAGGDPLGQAGGPGARVDVLVSTEPRDGAGRTFLALEDVELLALGGSEGAARLGRDEGPGEGTGAAATASTTATLRVTQRQAVYLTAAQNFAREVRLLPRPPGDARRAGRSAVSAAGL